MGFSTTTSAPEKPHPAQASCGQKTASRKFFTYPIKTQHKNRRNSLKTNQEKPLPTQKTASGVFYYKYRHYAPELGRWPSRDPIEEDGGVNLYSFVGNDPVERWDRLGQAGCAVAAPPVAVGTWSFYTVNAIGNYYRAMMFATAAYYTPQIRERPLVRDRGSERSRARRRRNGCTKAEVSKLQKHMHKICDRKSGCTLNMDCLTLHANYRRAKACAIARTDIQIRCWYNNTDKGHAAQIEEAWKNTDNCFNIAIAKGCKWAKKLN